ncbi:hypothetical protein PQR14_22140 [Paraburkholderia bryophila]|uniref:hypothetical protein n=1 Tax=Paraburkholderia bryophila TaxID=420952 RepID=UPI0038BD511C
MKTEDLAKKIEAARAEIRKAIMKGDSTAKLREYLRELEAEQARLGAVAAAQEAAQKDAQQALEAIERNRIDDAAQMLADARDNRLASISTRYAIPVRPIPDTRSSFTA